MNCTTKFNTLCFDCVSIICHFCNIFEILKIYRVNHHWSKCIKNPVCWRFTTFTNAIEDRIRAYEDGLIQSDHGGLYNEYSIYKIVSLCPLLKNVAILNGWTYNTSHYDCCGRTNQFRDQLQLFSNLKEWLTCPPTYFHNDQVGLFLNPIVNTFTKSLNTLNIEISQERHILALFPKYFPNLTYLTLYFATNTPSTIITKIVCRLKYLTQLTKLVLIQHNLYYGAHMLTTITAPEFYKNLLQNLDQLNTFETDITISDQVIQTIQLYTKSKTFKLILHITNYLCTTTTDVIQGWNNFNNDDNHVVEIIYNFSISNVDEFEFVTTHLCKLMTELRIVISNDLQKKSDNVLSIWQKINKFTKLKILYIESPVFIKDELLCLKNILYNLTKLNLSLNMNLANHQSFEDFYIVAATVKPFLYRENVLHVCGFPF